MPLAKDLEDAIERGDLPEIQRLIALIVQTVDSGEFLSDRDRHYLLLAAETGKTEIVKLLIDAGADLKGRDSYQADTSVAKVINPFLLSALGGFDRIAANSFG